MSGLRRREPVEVLGPCDCGTRPDLYDHDPATSDPGVGGLHYTYCPAYEMTKEEEIEWRKKRA